MAFGTNHYGSHGHNGGQAVRTRSVDDDYTLDVHDDQVLLVDTSGGAVTVTLPPVADAHNGTSGSVFTVVATSASNDVTLDGDGSETIDGATTATISGAYASQTVVCVGDAWVTRA